MANKGLYLEKQVFHKYGKNYLVNKREVKGNKWGPLRYLQDGTSLPAGRS